MIKIYKDLEQDSPEWHELKWGKVTGSIFKDVMVYPTKAEHDLAIYYTLKQQLQEDYNDDDRDDWTNRHAERGITLEPFAVAEVEKVVQLTGTGFEKFGFIHKEKHLGLSPDRLTETLRVGCEVKCPSGKVHLKYTESEYVPVEHVWQAVSYFVNVDELEYLFWASYRPENNVTPLYLLELTKNSKVNIGTDAKPKIVTIKEAMDMFWIRYTKLILAIYD